MVWLRTSSVSVRLAHYWDIFFFAGLRIMFVSTVVTEIIRLCFPIWNWDTIPTGHWAKFFFVFLSRWADVLLKGSLNITFFNFFWTRWWTRRKCGHRLFYFLLDLVLLIFLKSLLFLGFDRSADFFYDPEQELSFSLLINFFSLDRCCFLEK